MSLFLVWQQHEVSKPEHQHEIDRRISEEVRILNHKPSDAEASLIARKVAYDAGRETGLRTVLTLVVALALYGIVFWFFGDHWWYLGVAFVLWIGGIICIVLLQ